MFAARQMSMELFMSRREELELIFKPVEGTLKYNTAHHKRRTDGNLTGVPVKLRGFVIFTIC